jgi:phosphatidylglycerol---prolipoprotein diacylglyceryl transferase
MVALAMLAAYWLLRADLLRRGMSERIDAERLIAVPCLAGIAGAKLYHLLESPHDFLTHPLGLFFSQFGFAWFGGLIAGFLSFLWLSWRCRIPLLSLLDVASPAAALGYGIGRIGCFLSGDGDYGIPTSLPWGMRFPNGLVPTQQRVHPTPLYELIVGLLATWFLWRMTTPGRHIAGRLFGESRGVGVPSGSVFAAYLVISGVSRFFVEFIRINPRSVFGLTNAQVASLACTAAGLTVWWSLRRHNLEAASRDQSP